MKFNGIIYCRTNIVNGKKYIGRTTDEYKRQWAWNNLKSSYSGILINNARRKYGLSSFTYSVLSKCEADDKKELDEMLNSLEMYYIEKYNTKAPNGYNLTDGGEGVSGYKQTEDVIKKRVEKIKGRKRSKEWIEKLRSRMKGNQNMLGKHHSEEAKLKISNSNKGKKVTEERKMKISNTLKGRKRPTEFYDNVRKKVYQYNKDLELVKIWNSTKECSKNGYYQSAVCACCNGIRKTHKGFIWSYNNIEKK